MGLDSPVKQTKNVFWIVSYPKSGNTWVRFIVCHILSGRGIKNSGEIETLTPDVHKHPLQSLPLERNRLFLKTHWACTPSMPLYSRTVGAIYVVRHPGDVLASNLAYLRIPKDRMEAAVDQFIRAGGLNYWTRFKMGTWIGNLESWTMGQHSFPVHIVRYESMLRDPVGAVKKIAELIERSVSKEEAERIAAKTSFSAMQSMEKRERNGSLSTEQSFFVSDAAAKSSGEHLFMRSGNTGEYRSLLKPNQLRRLNKRFAPYLKELGL